MTGAVSFPKITRTIRIYAVVQVALMALLAYMAVNFQAKLQLLGRTANFMNAVIASFVIQLALFYPINRFASRQASRDIAASGANLSQEELKGFSRSARIGDVIKAGVICFYITFILKAPKEPVILCILFFSFILTVLTYFQCYNFAAKRCMKEKETAR